MSEDHDFEQVAGTFGYSHVTFDALGATEYTLVTLVVDRSGSTQGFASDLESAVGAIVHSCRQSPRADNLLLRVVAFNHNVEEIHGFKPLPSCAPDGYKGRFSALGGTALYDATAGAVSATARYGKDLMGRDYMANGVVFVLTDGCDEHSTSGPKTVQTEIQTARTSESLESVQTFLVGINEAGVGTRLADFQRDVGIDAYIPVKDASPNSLAKLVGWVSKSISNQSSALGTGGPSKVLTF